MTVVDGLPAGYTLERDADGLWLLTPPAGLGAPWIVLDAYVTNRDWSKTEHIVAACRAYLRDIGRSRGA